MQVDIDVELLRQVEQLFDLRIWIGVHIGTAADRFAAVAQRRNKSSSVPGSLVRPSCGNTQIDRSIAQA